MDEQDSQGNEREVAIAVGPLKQDQESKVMHHTSVRHLGPRGQTAAAGSLKAGPWKTGLGAVGWPWGSWSQAVLQGQPPGGNILHTGGMCSQCMA